MMYKVANFNNPFFGSLALLSGILGEWQADLVELMLWRVSNTQRCHGSKDKNDIKAGLILVLYCP